MIVFQNEGAIDLRCITTFGVSSKAIDNPIGYFGTGLKYAIAVCLRNACEIELITDGKRYRFGRERSKIRLHEFDVVTMNDEPLSFTIDLGKKWELWQAYRELYCNALDEGGRVLCLTDHDCRGGTPDDTFVMVRGAEFENIYRQRHLYFLTDYETRASDGVTDVIVPQGSGGRFFYKGILVGESKLPALFDYNFHTADDCRLTEDRTMKYQFECQWNAQALIQQSTDREFIREVLTAPTGTFEGQLDYKAHCRNGTKHGEFFLDVIGELRRELKDIGINPSAVLVHRLSVQYSILPTKSIELSKVEAVQLARARAFCIDVLGLALDNFPLIVCEDLGDGGLGRADIKNKVMYISRLCFQQGTKRVACSLLEEYTHVKYGVLDETPEQKWVYLQQILSLGEELQGEPL